MRRLPRSRAFTPGKVSRSRLRVAPETFARTITEPSRSAVGINSMMPSGRNAGISTQWGRPEPKSASNIACFVQLSNRTPERRRMSMAVGQSRPRCFARCPRRKARSRQRESVSTDSIAPRTWVASRPIGALRSSEASSDAVAELEKFAHRPSGNSERRRLRMSTITENGRASRERAGATVRASPAVRVSSGETNPWACTWAHSCSAVRASADRYRSSLFERRIPKMRPVWVAANRGVESRRNRLASTGTSMSPSAMRSSARRSWLITRSRRSPRASRAQSSTS